MSALHYALAHAHLGAEEADATRGRRRRGARTSVGRWSVRRGYFRIADQPDITRPSALRGTNPASFTISPLRVRSSSFSPHLVESRQRNRNEDSHPLRVLIAVHRGSDSSPSRKLIRDGVRVPRHDYRDKAAQQEAYGSKRSIHNELLT